MIFGTIVSCVRIIFENRLTFCEKGSAYILREGFCLHFAILPTYILRSTRLTLPEKNSDGLFLKGVISISEELYAVRAKIELATGTCVPR